LWIADLQCKVARLDGDLDNPQSEIRNPQFFNVADVG